jgi:hypothetical protein
LNWAEALTTMNFQVRVFQVVSMRRRPVQFDVPDDWQQLRDVIVTTSGAQMMSLKHMD